MVFTVDLEHKKTLGVSMLEYVYLKEVSILQSWEVGWCVKSNEDFASDYDLSKSAVQRMTKRLQEKGLIKRGTGTQKRATNLFLQGVAKRLPRGSETLSFGVAKRLPRGSETPPKIEIEIEKGNRNGIDKPEQVPAVSKSSDYSQEFERLWSDYDRKGNKKVSFRYWKKLSSEKKKIAAAAIPPYNRVVTAGRSRMDFQTFLNPANERFAEDWDKALKDWTKPPAWKKKTRTEAAKLNATGFNWER